MAAPTAPAPEAVAGVEAETPKLQKALGRFDLIFFTVCAMVTMDTLGTVASNGPQGFTWLIVLAIAFVLPYGLLMAEVGSAFPQEGGPYPWVTAAFGRLQGSIAAMLYWITNPLWIGGSLAFIATDAFSSTIAPIAGGSVWDYAFKLVFVWVSITLAIISLRRGKWIGNVGGMMRVVVLGLFTLTTIIYALEHGVSGFPVKDLSPTTAIFLGLVPVLLFNYVGFELQSGASEEMRDPQKDVPRAVARGGIISVLLYTIPILLILLVLPESKVTGIGGFLDAVAATFTVYGAAQHFLLGVMGACFILTLLASGTVWMMGGDRILAIAAADGALPGWFGVFDERLGTPVRVNVATGIVATIFCMVAVAGFQGGSDAKFGVVLTMTISTTLLSYLWIFPAAVRLRFIAPGVERPYRVPGGQWGIVVCGAIVTAWIALGSWVAVFPGTLESLVGLPYDFKDIWGVSQATFQTLTLATLVAILILALIGYWAGRPTRAIVNARALAPAES